MRRRRDGDLVLDSMIQQNHAVGDIFFEAVARQGALATLRGDYGRQVSILEPAEEAAKLRSQDALI